MPHKAMYSAPPLYSFYSHDCVAKICPNSIYKFSDDTTTVGQISDNDKTEYREEIENLAAWCKDNNLSINVNKTKELVINFGKWSGGHVSVCISGAELEMVENVKFFGDDDHQRSILIHPCPLDDQEYTT
eukprot:g35373.t1